MKFRSSASYPIFQSSLLESKFYCPAIHRFISGGSRFIKDLALGSVQCTAVSNSADLPVLSPNLPKPSTTNPTSTLSAGLPHFSTGYMRCWGRDTFIALRGLLLIPGRYAEARYTILGFAQCLRHGLIPNLLDNGTKPRFNCRDAIWWWLYSIRDYVTEVSDGHKLLADPVSRLFPTDDSNNKPPGEFVSRIYAISSEFSRQSTCSILYQFNHFRSYH